jgi:hypothetical protein
MKILFLFQLKESEKTRKVMKKKRNFILIKLYNRKETNYYSVEKKKNKILIHFLFLTCMMYFKLTDSI